KIKALLKALQSDEVKKFIEDKYDGAVVPVF
ncbi:MAG: MetQ/NlpA family ABC transporter substrate-binding protein, partial [Lachnospiraceae bacterium]